MNLSNLSETLGLDEADVLDLVELFLDTCEADVNTIEEGVKAGDHQQVADAAHSIKGASGNMRFEAIYALAKTIEDTARGHALTDVIEHLAGIRIELEQISSDLKNVHQ